MVEKGVVTGCLVTVLSFGCLLIAFASPYWVESFVKFQGRFTKIGLWEVCFNDYTFYKDYNGKRFQGCWYIFSDQIRPIWEWVSPPWFIVCQVSVSFTLLVQFLVGVVLIMYVIGLVSKHLQRLMILCASLGMGISTLVLLMELLLFGIMKEERDWVPRPDMNYLSWSYGFACVAFLFGLGATGILFSAHKNVGSKDDAFDGPATRRQNY